MKLLKVGILFFGMLFSIELQSQIFKSMQDIISDKGYDYKLGTTDSGLKRLTYSKSYTTTASGTYNQLIVYYFMTLESGQEICQGFQIVEPSTETNSDVIELNSKMVKIGYLKWEDYETNYIYQITVTDGLCIISVKYDLDSLNR